MKKSIAILMICLSVGYASQAQMDSSRTMTDTTTMDHNKNHNRSGNQDSINRKRKMPPKSNSGTMMADSTVSPRMNHNKATPKTKPVTTTPNP